MVTNAPSVKRRVLSNGAWGAGQQTVTMGLSAVFGLLLVVVLPVEEYGVYSYAVALASLGMAVMTAGLSGLAVKEIVENRDDNAQVIAALLIIREVFGVCGYIAIGLVSLTSGDGAVIHATIFAGLVLLARAADVPEAWFLSHLRTRRVAVIRVGVAVGFFMARIACLIWLPEMWIVLTLYVGEALIVSAWILTAYLRDKESPKLKVPAPARIGSLLKQSWPLLLSGVANQVNLRADVIILQLLLGTAAVGVYSAAARLSEIAYFLPVVFMNSVFPVLLSIRKEHGFNSPQYKSALQSAYDKAFWIGLAIAGFTALSGTIFIQIVFPGQYQGAIPVLWVHVLGCPFIFMSAVYSKWIIAEGLLWSSLVRHSLGAALNITLNFILVPYMGIVGAAWATVGSYICASFLATFIGRRSAIAGTQMALAIVAPIRLSYKFISRRINRVND